MSTTRLEKAIALPGQRIPNAFQHALTLDKPVYSLPALAGSLAARDSVSTLTLDAADLQRFQLWIAARENGTLNGTEELNVSPALRSAMDDFEAYLANPTYANWATVDEISRDAQWRLFCVDVAEAVNAKSTIPVSGDAFGQSENPIAPGDVGALGGEVTYPPSETVTTGDPVAPDTVYAGEDGSVVVVGGDTATTGTGTGTTGPAGPTGPAGARGSLWFVDAGDPATSDAPGISSAKAYDMYLDNLTGDVWQFNGTTRSWEKGPPPWLGER